MRRRPRERGREAAVCPGDPSAGPTEWDLLARDFLALVRPADGSQPSSDDVRQLLLGSPLFVAFVRRHARGALARASAADELLDDVQQEALADLAEQLDRQPDLHVDPSMAEHTFYSWIETIVHRRCGVIVARFVKLAALNSQLFGDVAEHPRRRTDLRIDVSQAIEKLDEPERSVLLLFHGGHSVRDIAQRLHMPYDRAYAAKRRGWRSFATAWPCTAPRALRAASRLIRGRGQAPIAVDSFFVGPQRLFAVVFLDDHLGVRVAPILEGGDQAVDNSRVALGKLSPRQAHEQVALDCGRLIGGRIDRLGQTQLRPERLDFLFIGPGLALRHCLVDLALLMTTAVSALGPFSFDQA